MDFTDGVCEKVNSETFSCIRINSVIVVDRTVVNHVDVSSCGIHYGDYASLSLT